MPTSNARMQELFGSTSVNDGFENDAKSGFDTVFTPAMKIAINLSAIEKGKAAEAENKGLLSKLQAAVSRMDSAQKASALTALSSIKRGEEIRKMIKGL